jgi:hypothetical protein
MDVRPNEARKEEIREFDAIVTRLYLGSMEEAFDGPSLRHHRVSHILSVARGAAPAFPDVRTSSRIM